MDWLSYIFNPAPRHLRRMGYVRELKELGHRRDRCAASWQPHLEQTRAIILEATERCERKAAVLIVGSGLLHDIPLRELSGLFQRVVLADIVQLRSVHRLARNYANVELVECDISGAVEHSYHCARARSLPRLDQIAADYFHRQDFDLVVSANILSQLAVLPNGYLSRRVREFTSERMAEFSRRLVEGHLDWLGAFPNRTCLIADLERLYCKGHRVIKREPSLWGVQLPDGYREWYWDLAPRPEFDFRHDVRHRIAGFTDFPAKAWRERQVEAAPNPQAALAQCGT